MIGSAVRGGDRRIVVFNGLSSMAARRNEGLRLMSVAFSAFETRRVFDKGAKVGEAQVWMGSKKTVPLVTTEPLDVAYMRVAKDGIKTTIVYEGPVAAPIKKDAPLAKLVFEGPGVARREVQLVAGEKVGSLNPFSKALIGARMAFGDKQTEVK
jgi:D-alanyl-D-alanine carboxypeptidase (penicillin-binding protein 5/6)